MSPHVHGGLHSSPFAISVTLVLIGLAWVYWRGWYQLRKALPDLVSGWRLAAFTGGVISLWAAVGSPLAALDHQLLTIHMVQHLLLMTVAAPALISLGAPALTSCCTSLPQRLRSSVLAPLLRWRRPCVRFVRTHRY